MTGLSSPTGIAVTDYIYWTDVGTFKVQRSDLDGSNVTDLVTGLSSPNGIAVTDYIYWVDDGTNKIQRSDLDGSNVTDLVTTGLAQPWSISVTDYIYWTDTSTTKIQRTDLDGNSSSYRLSKSDTVTIDIDAVDSGGTDAGAKCFITGYRI